MAEERSTRLRTSLLHCSMTPRSGKATAESLSKGMIVDERPMRLDDRAAYYYAEGKLCMTRGDVQAAKLLFEMCESERANKGMPVHNYRNLSLYMEQCKTHESLRQMGLIRTEDARPLREFLASTLGESEESQVVAAYAAKLSNHGHTVRSLSDLSVSDVKSVAEQGGMAPGHAGCLLRAAEGRATATDRALRQADVCVRLCLMARSVMNGGVGGGG